MQQQLTCPVCCGSEGLASPVARPWVKACDMTGLCVCVCVCLQASGQASLAGV